MKNQIDKVNPMIRIMTAAILLAANVLPASAIGTYDAMVGARLVDLDFKGSRGQVQEYDGKLYRGAHGDVSVSNQGARGLFDFKLNDIGSTEENGSLFLDAAGGFKGSVKYNRMSHRENIRDYFLILNGVPTKAAAASVVRPQYDWNLLFKRTEAELRLGYYHPANSARFVEAQYWHVRKEGDSRFTYNSSMYGAAVNNTTQDLSVSAGSNIREDAAVALDILRREFKDDSTTTPATATRPVNPPYAASQMTAGEMKFRYNAGKKLAFTGALTGRERTSLRNQYNVYSYVAALNGAYRPSNKLSLTAKLYSQMRQVDENTAFRNLSNNAAGAGNQFDKLMGRADLAASYRPIETVLLKAGYRLEVTHRRDAEEFVYAPQAAYADGVFIASNTHRNFIATDDTKHIGTVGAKVELPLDITFEADYRRLQANRPALTNLPTKSDGVSAGLFVPLPASLELSLMADYLKEGNHVEVTKYRQTRRSYRAGLDWHHEKMFLGADASYENIKYFTEGWFGQDSQLGLVNPALVRYEHVSGMENRTRNTTTGLHSRVICPKGFVILANGSYTWSVIQTPINMSPRSDVGFHVGDLTPNDVRIARGTLGVEYTPEKLQNLTARASYRVDHWVDKIDSANTGRASVAQVGASMKF